MRGTAWAFSVAMLLARVAGAEPQRTWSLDVPPRPPSLESSPALAQLTITAAAPQRSGPETASSTGDEAFTRRFGRITELMSRLEEREGAAFDELAARYVKLAEFSVRLEQREEIAFEERATRFARLVAFARELRQEQEVRESRDFESRLQRALRAQAFMQRLSHEREAARTPVSNMLAPEPEEWIRTGHSIE